MKYKVKPNIKIGKWHLLKKKPNDIYYCQCECGIKKNVSAGNLRLGNSLQCTSCALRERHKRKVSQKNIIGKTFGVLKILSFKANNNAYIYKCKCVCGNVRYSKFYIIKKCIKKCFCNNSIPNTFNSINSKIQALAIRRNIKYNLSAKFLENLINKQKYKCAISKLPIKFGKRHYGEETTASLDRINSDKGYTKNNVQWLHKNINLMKLDLSQANFISLCKEVAKKN